MSGDWHNKIRALHAEYGHIVRIGPDELSYDVPEAWEDIYGKPKRQKENGKPTWYLHHKSNEMVSAKEKEHGRMRRLLSPGFTSAAMVEQEPFIKIHVDLLLQRLGEKCDQGAGIDMFEWLSFCTFDIVGDLSFGEPFGCLRDAKLNPWLATVYANVKLAHTLTLGSRIPFFLLFLPIQKVWKLYQASRTFAREVKAMIDGQLAHDHQRPDFLRLMTTKRTSTVSCQHLIPPYIITEILLTRFVVHDERRAVQQCCIPDPRWL
jgi:cytochrome P450